MRAAPESTSSSASNRCSVEMYSSVSASASSPAVSRTLPVVGEIRTSAAWPCAYTLGMRSSARSTWSRTVFGVTPIWCSNG